MSKVRFDGEEGSIELERITAKKNWMSPEQCNKMGATYMFDALHRYMGKEMYPDLPNEVNGNVAVKQLPVYAFLKTKIEGTDQYNRKYIGNFTVGADKGDNGYFGLDNELCKDTAIRLEGTDHIKGVGFNYPWEVNGVKTIRYNADKEALCIVTGSDKTAWSAILEQSYVGNKETESEIEAYLEQEFKPAFDCAYRANPLLVGVTTTLDEINADIDGFKALRRSSDDRQYSYCEFWIDGEYDLYYLNLERNRYEKNGVNLYDELSDAEKALVDAAETLEEKNQVFINFRINRFKEEAPNYWHINDGLFQLSFLYNIAAKDNGEKNMYPYKLIPLSEGGRWRFFQDDLDSIKSKDNQGLDTASYSVELHDFTDDKKNAYVFKGEDNAYFQALEMAYPERFQKMGKDMLQAMYDISPKGTKTLDKLMGFFDEFFFSRAQDYFTKSTYNNDAEFYEEAWNDKEYVASVDIHPLAQSTGDHYTADRAWFEKRMLYLMAKYGFGSYSNYEDSSLGIISVRTQVAQGFTLIPAIDSFPTILGGQAQISKADHRIKAGESIKLAAVGGGNTNTYIVGADWLSDIGDLKDLSIDPSSVVVLSVASKRLRRLKVGDENPEEVTSYLATLSVQQCDSMETVDARNLKTLVGTVDLSKCPRLLEALFGGTNTTGVVIAAGSKIEHLQLPDSVTAIDLRNTKFLDTFEYGTLANLGFLRLENVPTLNAFAMLKEAYNSEGSQLKDIRLVGWTYNGDATDLDMLANLATDKDKDGNDHTYNGIDAEGTPTTGNPVLEGTLNVEGYVYEDTANIVQQYYPTIQFTPKGYYVIFADPEVQRIVAENWGDGTGITQEQVEAVTDIGTVFKGNAIIETFDEFEKFESINEIGSSNEYGAFDRCTNLRRIVLPTNCNIIKSQCFRGCNSLEFINLENVTEIGQENFVGTTKLTISINTPLLKSLGVAAFKNSGITSIENLGNITKLNGINEYGTFYLCKSLQQAVLPNTLKILGHQEFRGCTALTSIVLPKSITGIGNECFRDCTSLAIEDLSLPDLETLGQNAFYGVSIKKISNLGKITALPAADYSSQNFGKKDVLEEVVFPTTMITIPNYSFNLYTSLVIEDLNLPNLTSIGQDSFSNTKIKRISDLGNISILSVNAFLKCTELISANIPCNTANGSSTSTGCFNGCTSLEFISLRDSITRLGSYSFYGCISLANVTLPLSLLEIGGSCFQKCSSISFTNWDVVSQNITKIESYAFNSCSNFIVEELRLPKLTTLGGFIFNGTTIKRVMDLGSITVLERSDNGIFGEACELAVLPKSLTEIQSYCIRNMPLLKTVVINAIVPPVLSANGNSFSGMDIYVPDVSVEAYKQATNWSAYADRIMSMFYYLGYIDFADPNVLQVLLNAGYDTDADGKISIEEAAAVTDIGTAFKNNKNITHFDEFKYFTGLTSFSSASGLNGCANLEVLTFPDTMTGSSGWDLLHNIKVRELTIPKGCSIQRSFGSCHNLEVVTFKGAAALSNYPFQDCENLKEFKTSEDNEDVISINKCIYSTDGKILYAVPTGIGQIEFAEGVTNIYHSGLNNVILEMDVLKIPNTVTTIGVWNTQGGVANVKGVRKLYIPNSVRTLGQGVFSNGSWKIVEIQEGSSMSDFRGTFGTCTNLDTFIVRNETPITGLKENFLSGSKIANGTGFIYVPVGSVEDYKVATIWLTYADQIKPINVADTLPDISTVVENDLYEIGDVCWKAELVNSELSWVEV